ncbi:hypothetical protein [Salinicoccus albus]|uniref:hypothetical protein n=1 Tax=Salinicoccus albus TaxID=418756 RepID=UPI00037B00F7|nr:hypothetical protein [Salinicoccus albus]
MREKNEKLKVYEFLYNRLPFSEDEAEELEALQRMEKLEKEFESHLSKIKTGNMEIHWHSEVLVDSRYELVNVLIATDYCYYMFVLRDLHGEHYINSFNILCDSSHEAVLDLNRSDRIYEIFRDQLIDDGKYQRPVILKYVVMNEKFSLTGSKSEKFLNRRNLDYYLKAIEHSAVIKKKHYPPVTTNF